MFMAAFCAAVLAYALIVGFETWPGTLVPVFASLMRFIDSSTLVTSEALGSKVLSWPVLTSPAVSVPLAILVGCAAMFTMPGGAMELPPDWPSCRCR